MDPDDLNSSTPVDWQEIIERNRWFIFIGLSGLAMLGLGVRYLTTPNTPDRVEIISSPNSPSISSEIVVDIAGEVVNPGIYHLPQNARIQDAITSAGGLSDRAARDWIAKNLNRAAKLTDGQKLYIPMQGEDTQAIINQNTGQIAGSAISGTVSINSANQAQLESLWGVGPVTAAAIIDGRPYSSVQELLDRKIIKQNVWDRNSDKLSL